MKYNKTSLLDLTSDINVALFFATQKYEPESDTYNPITDENHVAGVLYFYEIDIMEDFKYGMDNKQLSTIGLQVFPRSGKQRGFLFHHNIDDNFNDLPRLKAFRFKHNAKIAKEISEQMNGGESLFPGDTEGKMMNDLLNLPNNPKYEWAFKENVSHVIDYKQGVMLKQFEHILKE